MSDEWVALKDIKDKDLKRQLTNIRRNELYRPDSKEHSCFKRGEDGTTYVTKDYAEGGKWIKMSDIARLDTARHDKIERVWKSGAYPDKFKKENGYLYVRELFSKSSKAVKRPKLTLDEVKNVVALYDKTRNVSLTGEKLGINPVTVSSLLRLQAYTPELNQLGLIDKVYDLWEERENTQAWRILNETRNIKIRAKDAKNEQKSKK